KIFQIGQHQVSPLIGREAAGEADGERVRAEDAGEPLYHLAGFAAILRLFGGAAAHELQQARLKVNVGLPQLAIVDVFNALPGTSLAALQVPACPEMAVVKADHLRSQPG